MSVFTAAMITVSDTGSRGERKDTAGPACCEILQNLGFEILYTSVVPDEKEQIRREILHCTDELDISLVFTCGGTGFSKRDVSPEAASECFERNAPGIAEAMRYASFQITPKAILSRAVSGLRGSSIIITLPGSLKASTENLNAIAPALRHGVEMLRSQGSNHCGG